MDVLRARVALRERSLPEVLDLVVRFVFSRKAAFAKVAAFVLLPGYALTLAFAEVAGWAWGWVAAVALGSLAQAPFTALASRHVFADVVRTRDVLRASLKVLPTLVGVRILQALAMGPSMLLLLLPVLWVGTIMLFVVEVVVLEHSSAGAAFGRASRLSGTRFADGMLAFLVLSLIPFVITLVSDVAGRALLQDFLQIQPPPPVWTTGGGWLSLLGFWVSIPFTATARFFVYLDFRTRSEGWDIQTRFAALVQRSVSEHASEPQGAEA
jgi:hypothetical protein